jgi:formylglycine-generating enzyme required for sulfatase activity
MPDVEIKRGYVELPDNNLRFGIRVANTSDDAILDVEVILDYSESYFRLEGDKIQNFGSIGPAGQATAEFILKPRSCIHSQEIGATVRYKDHKYKRHTVDMRAKEVHCVRPWLQEKAMREGEFIELARSLDQRAEGFTFSGIGVPELTAFLKTSCARRLYLISEYNVEGTMILNFAGESKEKACYLLTAVIKPSRNYAQIVFRAYSDKPYGLSGFLNETAESLRHLVGAVQSAREIGIIKQEQVINIIDSVVQRTTFAAAGGEGAATVHIEGSVVERSEFKSDEEAKRRRHVEEERLRREQEERERLRREEERKEQERKAREEAEKREREKQERLRQEEAERKERERKAREEQERLRKEEEEKKERERKAKEEAEKRKREQEQKARQETEQLKREQEEQKRKRQEQERLDKERKEREQLQEKKAKEIKGREPVKIPEAEKGMSRTKIFAVIIVLGAALLGYWGFTALSHDGTQTGAPAALPTQTPPLTPSSSPTPAVTPAPTPAVTLGNTFTNSIGMEFTLIPAGEFEMGSPSNEEGRYDDEGPVHEVTIKKAFYMGSYEVTQEQWRAVMGNNPSRFKSLFKGDNRPVETVSWDDVQEFTRKLNEKEGTGKYRLPSEAEWEYACRAGTTTRYSFGDSDSKLGEYAWYYDNSGSKTHPVGQKKPNPWGLYDLHGNVYEWVQDTGHGDYNGAPTDGSAWEGAGAFRVDRGGSWRSFAGGCRSAFRGLGGRGSRSNNLGFRLVRDV